MTLPASGSSETVRNRFLAAAVLLFAAVAGTLRLKAYDLFWHLAGGRWILEHGALPRSDPFRFTSVQVPWVDHEWLFQVLVAALERAGGLPLLVIARTAWIVLLAALLWTSIRRSGASALATAWIVLVAILGARGRFFLRPELVSLVGLAAVLALLQRFRRTGDWRAAVAIPILVMIWVNFHPGALLAAPVTAAYLVGSRLPGGRAVPWRWVIGLPVLCALAVLANPYGIGVFTVPAGIAEALQGLPGVNPEWLPVWKAPQVAFLAGVAAVIALAVLRRRSLDPATGLAALALTVLAATGVRHQGLFFIGVAFFAGEVLRRDLKDINDLKDPKDGQGRVPPLHEVERGPGGEASKGRTPSHHGAMYTRNSGLALLACLLAGFWCIWPPSRGPLRPRQGTFRPGLGLEPNRFPEKAADDLAKRPGIGNLYNDVAWGGYLLWRLYPPRRVFIDARNEVNPGLLHELAAARSSEEGWNALLERYGIDAALVRYDERPRPVMAAPELFGGPPRVEMHTSNALFFPRERFALVYWDDVAMVFLRRTPERAALLAREEYRSVHPEDWRAMLDAAADPSFRASALDEIERRLHEDPGLGRALFLRQRLQDL